MSILNTDVIERTRGIMKAYFISNKYASSKEAHIDEYPCYRHTHTELWFHPVFKETNQSLSYS